MSWLETLVWPGQEERAARLRDAIAIARTDRPRVVRGNLLTDLESLMAEAPREANLVVFHTAVLVYVAPSESRERFAEIIRASKAVWISNEAPGVFPSFAEKAPASPTPGRFLLAINGEPVAWAGPHGQSLDWFGA